MVRRDFLRLVMAAILGSVVTLAVPAMGAVLNQAVGDPLSLGNVNRIDERTDLKGKAKGANLQIKNTGNSGALTAKADKNAVKAKATDGPVALNAKAQRNAVKIKVDDGQSPIKVNASAGTAENLSADEVDGYHAQDLLRVGTAASDDLPDGNFVFTFFGGVGHVLQVDIEAPHPGWLIATGNVDAFNGTEANTVDCLIRVNGADVIGSRMESDLDPGGSNHHQCTTHGAVEVTAGTHTVFLRLQDVKTTTKFFDGSLTVLFVPFGASGAPAG